MYIEDELYKEIVDKTIIQTVDIIFLNSNNQILLGLRNNKPLKGVYYLPGGRRFKNETINESLLRKFKNEIGISIDLKKIKFVGVYDDIFEDSIFDGITTHCSNILFLYKLSDQEVLNIKRDEQHEEFRFFNLNDKNLHFLIKERLEDAKRLKII